MATPLDPVAPRERVVLMDALRGFAVFGILIVNMQFFFSPVYLFGRSAEWWRWQPHRDQGRSRRRFAGGSVSSLAK